MTMMMMKNPIILVTCILLFSSLAVLASENSFTPAKCCMDYYPNRLPKNKVLSFKYTDKMCSKDGLIFTMKRGSEFCVNPSLEWVRNITEAKEWEHIRPVNSPGSN